MVGHVAEAIGDNCYALSWSYGEICCHCGCCSNDPLERAKARLAYHLDELEERKARLSNAQDLLDFQKHNIEESINYHTAKAWQYRAEVERLDGDNDG